MTAVLWLVPGIPLLVAAASVSPARVGRTASALVSWAALPALVTSLLPGVDDVRVYGVVLLDSRLGLDAVGRIVLFLTAFLWLAAGVYARPYLAHDRRRAGFDIFFLLAMSGNLGLVLAQDAVTFYAFFALMTLAAYGLVVHERTPRAWRAGRVYMIMAVFGELLILTGLLLAVFRAGTVDFRELPAAVAAAPEQDLIVAALLLGFGVKVGALPVHMWLPLAHPVAPTPASAVLSGAMIKAGLIGWLRVLPLGETAFPGWGGLVVTIGLAGAFVGAALGVTQDDLKTLLAYSSISQMGLITTAVGLGLLEPATRFVAVDACVAAALHHGLVKGALFLGVGVIHATGGDERCRWVALAGLGLGGLSLAGAPLTGGAVAKAALKEAVASSPGAWPTWLDWLLPLAAVGTTILMGRFWLLALRDSAERGTDHAVDRRLWAPWAALLLGGVLSVWVVPSWYGVQAVTAETPALSALWAAFWPVVVGLALLWIGRRLARRAGGPRWRVEGGDVVALFGGLERWLGTEPERWGRQVREYPAQVLAATARRACAAASRLESALAGLETVTARWGVAGVLLLCLLGALTLAFSLH